jgi:stage II sporulation protein AA (anti-sigma F factor antagonist)
MPGFQCSTSGTDGLIVVTVAGDVDFAVAEVLWEELGGHLIPSAIVLMECSGISFMDSMGLRTLIRAHDRAAEQKAGFALVGVGRPVCRVLELTGLSGLIPQFTDLEAARAGRTTLVAD